MEPHCTVHSCLLTQVEEFKIKFQSVAPTIRRSQTEPDEVIISRFNEEIFKDEKENSSGWVKTLIQRYCWCMNSACLEWNKFAFLGLYKLEQRKGGKHYWGLVHQVWTHLCIEREPLPPYECQEMLADNYIALRTVCEYNGLNPWLCMHFRRDRKCYMSMGIGFYNCASQICTSDSVGVKEKLIITLQLCLRTGT